MTRAELYTQLDAANDKLRDVKLRHTAAEREMSLMNFRLHKATIDRDRIWGKLMRSLETENAQPTPAVME